MFRLVKDQKSTFTLPIAGMLISELLLVNDCNQKVVEPSGIEPLTSCVQGRRSPS